MTENTIGIEDNPTNDGPFYNSERWGVSSVG